MSADAQPLPNAPDPAIPSEPPKGAMRLLIFIAMMDLFGFGLIIPLLPFYIPGYEENTILQNLKVTILFSIYSICQFVGAPVLGLMSDRFGRRPVLALSQAGSAIGYAFLAIAAHFDPTKVGVLVLTLVYISRIIDGFTGGNLSTVQAYIADVTTPKNRAKWMGMLGAAFGVGFVLGPTTGGILGHYNHSLPAYFAMVMSAGAGILSWFMLPESRPKQPAEAEVWLHPRSFLPIFRQPILSQLLYISFFVMASFVMMESTAAVYLSREFHWKPLKIGLFFGYLGVVIILVQGGLVGRLTKKVGEWKLTTLGPFLVALGMVGFTLSGFAQAYVNTHGGAGGSMTKIMMACALLTLLAGGAINASGRSLQQPTMSSLMSQYSRPEEHGAVFGLYHGLGSLARVVGPLLAAPAFTIPWMHGTGQFAVAGVIALAMAVWTNKVRKQAGKPIEGNDKNLSVAPTAGEAHGVTAEPA